MQLFLILLSKLSQVPPFDRKVIDQKYWVVSEQVDKTLFRQEVQEFCKQFPIYSLQEVDLNSTSAEKIDGGRTRIGKKNILRYHSAYSHWCMIAFS